MLKIKNIQISGFRGILNTQNLKLNGNSIVIFGENSRGKSSFTDGIEWFLSNEIEYLKKEGAGKNSYPNMYGKNQECFIELEFNDPNIGTIKKKFISPSNNIISDENKLNSVKNSFIIAPYLRYSDIAKFVFATKSEKYNYLAKWMGFSPILEYQLNLEKSCKNLNDQITQNNKNKDLKKAEIEKITDSFKDESDILSFCNSLLRKYEKDDRGNIEKTEIVIKELEKKVDKDKIIITHAKENLQNVTFNQGISDKIEEIKKKYGKNKKIDFQILNLSNDGLKIITNNNESICPLCSHEWENRELLIQGIKKQIDSLSKIKEEKNNIDTLVKNLNNIISEEIEKLGIIAQNLVQESVKNIISEDKYKNLKNLKQKLSDLNQLLSKNELEKIVFDKNLVELAQNDLQEILKLFDEHKIDLKQESELTKDLSVLKKIISLWKEFNNITTKNRFFEEEIKKFTAIKDKITEAIKGEIQNKFDSISGKINDYFCILRNDVSLSNIAIRLSENQRAFGRSAEIELDFYDKNISPPYKILSESLLNSLGLSIFFACIKEYNTNCGFVVLDDIINSLDMTHRNNVLKLFQQEFLDYQLLVFTHDEAWFNRMVNNFHSWEKQKIINWSPESGPTIKLEKCSKDEILNLCSTETKTAGYKLGIHLEAVLNEICENIEAKINHRYFSKSLPALNELFCSFRSKFKKFKNIKDTYKELIEKLKDEQKNFVDLRNFCDHPKQENIASVEIKNACNQWFEEIEEYLFCRECNSFIQL